MKLYLIRHGQSRENVRCAHAGQMDSPLTEQGEKDALGAKKVLHGIKFDKVYSSDLIRASRTQQIALPGTSAKKLPLIREINVGSLEGKVFKECEEEFGKLFTKNRAEYNFLPYGGENYEMLKKRAEEFLGMIAMQDFECVAAFTHGGFINAVLGVVLGCKVTNVNSLSDNCGVSVFEYNDGKWRLHKWNITAGDI